MMKPLKKTNKSKPICNKDFKNSIEFKMQPKIHIYCKMCDFKSTNKNIVLRHQAIHKKSILCSICQFKCSTKGKLKNHMLAHSGEKYFECYHCDYISRQQCLIKQHIARRHSNLELFKCSYCDFKAVDEHVVERHTLKLHKQIDSGIHLQNKDDSDCIHEPEKRTRDNVKFDNNFPLIVLKRCDENPDVKVTQSESDKLRKYNILSEMLLKEYNYMSDNSLNNNLTQNDMLIEPCVGGGTVYRKTLQLQDCFEIVASIYSGVQNGNFENNQCEISFRKREDLLNKNEEQLSVSGNRLDNDENGMKKLDKLSNKEKEVAGSNTKQADIFKCSLCEFTCLAHKNLVNHIRKRHKSKTSHCGKCTYTRKNTSDLEKHLMSHTKKTHYNCDSCHFTSNSKSIFEIHRFIHSGKSEHMCNVCHYKTSTKYSLKRHIELHSKKKQRPY